MLYSLIAAGKIKLGDKVVVPTVSWSTDLAPVVQLGLEPILCDCNMEDLSIDINHFKNIIKEHNPKALMLVSVLGLVPQMDEILDTMYQLSKAVWCVPMILIYTMCLRVLEVMAGIGT